MGDRRKRALGVPFDGKLKLEFQGAKITSDAGLLAFRELDEAFRLTERGSTILSGPRHGKNTSMTPELLPNSLPTEFHGSFHSSVVWGYSRFSPIRN